MLTYREHNIILSIILDFNINQINENTYVILILGMHADVTVMPWTNIRGGTQFEY
jgi:hypothetical protein